MTWLVRMAVAVLAAAMLPLPAIAAPPAAPPAQTRAPDLEFVGQTAWLRPGEPWDLRLRVRPGRAGGALELAATVFRRVGFRLEFNRTLDDRITGSVVSLTRVPVGDLAAGDDGTVTVTLTPQLSRPGVYPVRVELREQGGGPVVDSLVTHLVQVPAQVEGERLAVATVFPVHAEPALSPEGTVELDRRQAAALADLAAGARDHPQLPLTFWPTAETLDALVESPHAADLQTLATLVQAATGRSVVADHYVRTDLPTLVRAGLTDEIAAQRTRAVDRITEVFGARPDTRTWIADGGLDAITLSHLRDQQIDRVLVPEPALEPIDLPITLAETFEIGTATRKVRAAAIEPALSAHFTREVAPALAAHHLLADLAVLYFDRPGLDRGIPVVAPSRWQPDAAFVAAFLGGLASSPLLAPTSVDGLFEDVPLARRGRGTLVRNLKEGAGSPIALDRGDIGHARQRLLSFATVLAPGNPVFDRMERLLLTSQSVDLDLRQRRAYRVGLHRQIDAEISHLHLPLQRSITLTARQGEIPVTVTSDAPYPVTVVLRVQSQTLDFPHGDRHVLQLRRNNATTRVAVTAPTSGSFPLRVRLESPDGGLVLAETRFTVRSTAVSGVGVGLSAGAGLFLVVWWGRHLRGRRARKLVPA